MPLELVKYNKCRVVGLKFEFTSFLLDVGNKNPVYIIDHCVFICPVIGAECCMPTLRECDSRKAPWSRSLIDKLNWKKVTSKGGSKHGSYLSLVVDTGNFTLFAPSLSMVQELTGM